ncbi:hypothetical protein B9Z55_007129 [Caenorhabditis nigoni]|uniref:Uncharacterized protein n=1 Tax=Caenorhabditis nigoni TaxID=1611254 RepID=A0A2G5V841_9PELO|nr:hypothetical protein B9Z55_007129 [Caenorhabditis nigoni]
MSSHPYDKKVTDAEKPDKKQFKEYYNGLIPEYQEATRDGFKAACDAYMKRDSYNNGDTDTHGYFLCCDVLGFCGGVSVWIIFLIILIVIGCLAAAGAAFWFFYWKRKMGGRDEEKEVESGEDTTKSGYDISVDTY